LYRRLSSCAPCILLGVFLVSVPLVTMAEVPLPVLTFGSEKVLRNCWSDAELQGKPEDKVIIRTRHLSPAPSRLITPISELCSAKPTPANSIRRVIPVGDQKVIALTFDLCERADEITGYDYAIVNYLRSHQVRATFFSGGKWMQTHPIKAIQLMADPLFEVGNHSWTHVNMRIIGKDEQLEQILLTQAEYRELRRQLACWPCAQQAGANELAKIPAIPQCFRFPFGVCTAETLQLLHRLNLSVIQWDVVADDGEKDQTAGRIARNVLRDAKPGSIVVMHANGRGRHTARALALVVPELKKRGYAFVTVSELLTLGQPVTAAECYELTPGDNKRYDTLFGNGVKQPKKTGGASLP
jgi:peptidoglycan/xylan/chitin deacetylase (PgdA/CDA1 family)